MRQPEHIQKEMIMDKLRLYSGISSGPDISFSATFFDLDNLKNEYFASTIINLLKTKQIDEINSILHHQPINEDNIDIYSLISVAYADSNDPDSARSILARIAALEEDITNAAIFLTEGILQFSVQKYTDARINLINSVDTLLIDLNSSLSQQIVFVFGELISDLLVKLGLFRDCLALTDLVIDSGIYTSTLGLSNYFL